MTALSDAVISTEGGSYMKHLQAQDHGSADIALGPVLRPKDPSDDSQMPEWLLPCHSIMLSSRSAVFAASTFHAKNTAVEETADGKRIVRLPLHQGGAMRLLQYCYGTLTDLKKVCLVELAQLVVISDMLHIEGWQDCTR